jgi:hypothetical protein
VSFVKNSTSQSVIFVKRLDEISTREKFWDHCYPWTEGLAMLFDAAQQEVVSQFNALGDDARQAESLLINLPAFRRIA